MDAEVPETSFDILADSALRGLPRILEYFQLPPNFVFEPSVAFRESVGNLYAHDPVLATHLLGCHSDWLSKWIDAHNGIQRGDATAASMRTCLGQIAALLENVCIHLFSIHLEKMTKSLILVEIPAAKRNPLYQRRFEIVLASDGAKPWTLEYTPGGFDDQ